MARRSDTATSALHRSAALYDVTEPRCARRSLSANHAAVGRWTNTTMQRLADGILLSSNRFSEAISLSGVCAGKPPGTQLARRGASAGREGELRCSAQCTCVPPGMRPHVFKRTQKDPFKSPGITEWVEDRSLKCSDLSEMSLSVREAPIATAGRVRAVNFILPHSFFVGIHNVEKLSKSVIVRTLAVTSFVFNVKQIYTKGLVCIIAYMFDIHPIISHFKYLTCSMHPPVMFSAPPKVQTGKKCQRHYVHPYHHIHSTIASHIVQGLEY
ncbi:hypothetical protein SFRURICE_013927 [Spodoptera frugiperda]|nr:hypothetical protein SFRURICE_013927 [Spodoptera frugiperda]